MVNKQKAVKIAATSAIMTVGHCSQIWNKLFRVYCWGFVVHNYLTPLPLYNDSSKVHYSCSKLSDTHTHVNFPTPCTSHTNVTLRPSQLTKNPEKNIIKLTAFPLDGVISCLNICCSNAVDAAMHSCSFRESDSSSTKPANITTKWSKVP